MELKQAVDVLDQAINLANQHEFKGFTIKDAGVISLAIETVKNYVVAKESNAKEIPQVEHSPKLQKAKA